MKKIFFFVHIPKTAGTSFRTALQQNSSVRMLYDYGESSTETSHELINVAPQLLKHDNPIFHDDKYNFLCGHVDYHRYGHCVAPSNVISIVRNPVERIVSEYQHLKRHGGLTASFQEFCSEAVQQNKQWRLLRGLSEASGALFGLASHYKYFVELFAEKYSLQLDTISTNIAPQSDSEDRFNITPKEIAKAYQLNSKDMALFFRLADCFTQAISAAGYNTAPRAGIKWSSRIVGKRVLGWVSCREVDCFFLLIRVNGEKKAIISLDQNRSDVQAKGLSEVLMCGFSYPLSLLAADLGDTVSVEFLGSKNFKIKMSIS